MNNQPRQTPTVPLLQVAGRRSAWTIGHQRRRRRTSSFRGNSSIGRRGMERTHLSRQRRMDSSAQGNALGTRFTQHFRALKGQNPRPRRLMQSNRAPDKSAAEPSLHCLHSLAAPESGESFLTGGWQRNGGKGVCLQSVRIPGGTGLQSRRHTATAAPVVFWSGPARGFPSVSHASLGLSIQQPDPAGLNGKIACGTHIPCQVINSAPYPPQSPTSRRANLKGSPMPQYALL
jgi:hypothetical protein